MPDFRGVESSIENRSGSFAYRVGPRRDRPRSPRLSSIPIASSPPSSSPARAQRIPRRLPPRPRLQPTGFPGPAAEAARRARSAPQTVRTSSTPTNADPRRLQRAQSRRPPQGQRGVRGQGLPRPLRQGEGNIRDAGLHRRGPRPHHRQRGNVYGERVTMDFVNENYVAERAETQLAPDLLQNRVTDKLYVSGKLSRRARGSSPTPRTASSPPATWTTPTTASRPATWRSAPASAPSCATQAPDPRQDDPPDPLPRHSPRGPDRSATCPTSAAPRTRATSSRTPTPSPIRATATSSTREDFMEKKGVGPGRRLRLRQPRPSGRRAALQDLRQARPSASATTTARPSAGAPSPWTTTTSRTTTSPPRTRPSSNMRGAVTYNDLLADRALTRLTLNRTSNSAAELLQPQRDPRPERPAGPSAGLRTDSQLNLLTTGSSYQRRRRDRDQARSRSSSREPRTSASARAPVQYQRTIPVGETHGLPREQRPHPRLQPHQRLAPPPGPRRGRRRPLPHRALLRRVRRRPPRRPHRAHRASPSATARTPLGPSG